jgi:Fe-S cluster biogenesis protein NfuA
VYAILNSSYRRGTEGWEAVEHVGFTSDLKESVRRHSEEEEGRGDIGAGDLAGRRVAHVRALSFTVPEPSAMRMVALQWRERARTAGAPLDQVAWSPSALEYLEDEDDDDDDDDDDWRDEISPQAATPIKIASPFADKPSSSGDEAAVATVVDGGGDRLPLTAENIDRVLEEVRPYLIADGWNVAVSRVDADRKIVYLQLQGACGSCPSSTVTMQMGIERVLKEHFDVDQVLQEDDPNKPTALTWQAVEVEVNRIRPAIMAMGGVCELLGVEPSTGVVKIKFRGFNKVQQGLELAIRDLPFVNSVQFVTGDKEE